MKIVLERSSNKIYDRITIELARGFIEAGHTCTLVQPAAIRSFDDLITAFDGHDFALITHSIGWLSQRHDDGFFFEHISTKLIFLHHDAPFNTPDISAIGDKLRAFQRVAPRSVHLTIEKSDAEDLRRLGILCHETAHLCSFSQVVRDQSPPTFECDVSFIGHVLPEIDAYIQFGTNEDIELYKAYQHRSNHLDFCIKNDFSRQHNELLNNDPFTFVSRRASFIQQINTYTTFHRGHLLQSFSGLDLIIYGGDPAWMHGMNQTRLIASEHVRYAAPVFAPMEVARIFQSTRVNLNITSLQFDTAVINRLADCAMAGGFMLTDRKLQLNDLTCVAEEISYGTPEEMIEKLVYHCDPSHAAITEDIRQQMMRDLTQNCSVETSIETILRHAHAI